MHVVMLAGTLLVSVKGIEPHYEQSVLNTVLVYVRAQV